MKRYRHRRSANPANAFPNPLEPGELAVNTANRQLAIGDSNATTVGVPLPLIAIRYFDARGSYAAGDMVMQAGKLYTAIAAVPPGAFNASQWTEFTGGATGDFLPLAGGQLTGNLGIGVPNDFPLQIGNGLSWNFVVADWGTEQDTFKDGQYDGNWTYYGRARGTVSAPTKVQNGDALGGIAWIAADGTLPYPNICNITIDGRVDGPVSAGVVPCAMVFNTGTGAAGVERLRIGSDGKVKFVNPVPIVDVDQVPTKLYVDNKVAAVPVPDLSSRVKISGDVMTGDLTIDKTSPVLALNDVLGGNTADVRFNRNGKRRWLWRLGGDAESGGNTGSSFTLVRYDDDGVSGAANAIQINRANSEIYVAKDPTQLLGVATKQYVDAGVRAINYTNTTAYTFVLSDTGKLVLLNNTGNLAQSATVPANSTAAFAIGAQIDLCVTATNVVTTIAPAAGVTIWSEGSKRKLPMSGSCATLVKIGTDMWSLCGSLIA